MAEYKETIEDAIRLKLEQEYQEVTKPPSVEEMRALVVQEDTTEENKLLERECAAEAAVYVVMRQIGLEHPTLHSKWCMNEITRLLHQFYADPRGEIKLGGQVLGDGLKRRE